MYALERKVGELVATYFDFFFLTKFSCNEKDNLPKKKISGNKKVILVPSN